MRVCVWEFPVRLTHWINFIAILALSFTGYYIGKPFLYAISTDQYIMGTMRFIHYITAYLFLMSFAVRIYWAFAGNQYSNWRTIFPFTKKRYGQLRESARFFLLISRRHSHLLGHSIMAGLTYFFLFFFFLLEIITGFALYSDTHKSFLIMVLGGWLAQITSIQIVRLFHHIGMWLILSFLIFHVYAAWFVDSHERNGLIGSIFTGYKYVTREWKE